MERVLLVDGMALLFRSFYAMGSARLTGPDGAPIGAVFGFLKTLLKVIREQSPTHLAVCWDLPGKTFRHEMYTEYKAHRKETPPEILTQIPLMQDILTEAGLASFGVPGFEGDDVIGTLATRLGVESEVFILSGDKDFMQLVTDQIRLVSLKKGDDYEVLGPDQVADFFGVGPERVIDVLALRGDASDNVPGVRGIGEKKAAMLVRDYGAVEEIYQDLDRVTDARMRNALAAGREDALLSKKLVTIVRDVPVPFGERELRFDFKHFLATSPLRARAQALGMRSVAAALVPPKTEEPTPAKSEPQTTLFPEPSLFSEPAPAVSPDRTKAWEKRDYRVVRTAEELAALCERIVSPDLRVFAFDTETTGLDPIEDVPIGASVCFESGTAWYVPAHEAHPTALRPAQVWEALGRAFAARTATLLAHNLKFDAHMLANVGVSLGDAPIACSMVAAWLCDPTDGPFGLDALTLRFFNLHKIPTSDLIGRQAGRTTMLEVPLEILSEYACEDVDATLRIWEPIEKCMRDGQVDKLFHEMEMPFLRVLLDMERAGVFIDTALLSELGERARARLLECEREVFQHAGRVFNVASPKQLGEVLFEEIRVHESLGFSGKLAKTTLGYKTDAAVLEQFDRHPLVAKVLEYRETAKLLNTYIEVLPRLIKRSTGRVHTEFHQIGTVTGRLSSSNPNLQNIPVRTVEGRQIRAAIAAPGENEIIVAGDYSQIELRVLAHLAQDPAMISAFTSGADIHRETAARIQGCKPEEVTPAQRAAAKAINFGIIYGMGAQRLAREQEIPLSEAKAFIDRYFATYSGVKAYIERQHELGRTHHLTRTLFGRPRPIPTQGGRAARMADNVAVNSPIQGTAADLMKLGMIRLHHALKGMRSRIVLQVHDELVLEVPASEQAVVVEKLRDALQGAAVFAVPLLVEIGTGRNWLEAK